MTRVKRSGWAAGEPATRFDWVTLTVGAVAFLVFCIIGGFLTGYGAGVLKVVAAVVGGILAVLAGLAIYFMPTIVAALGKHPLVAPVIVLNVFLGWTFVGWVVALALAVWPASQKELRP